MPRGEKFRCYTRPAFLLGGGWGPVAFPVFKTV